MISKVVILALCVFGAQADYHLPKSADEVSKVYIPHSTYGIPHEDTPYPAPHNEYGVPTLKRVEPLVSKYEYKIPEVKTVYAPAEVYGVPTRYAAPVETIVSKYEYNLPEKVVKVAPYPHEVYGPPKEVKLVREEPVITSHYEYKIPKIAIVEEKPYPAPHLEYGVPVVPHTKYGVPE